MRYFRLMRLLRLTPAAIEQRFGCGHTGSIRRTRFIHDGSKRLDGLFGVHSCQRRDFEWSFSHLTSPRLPATATGLLATTRPVALRCYRKRGASCSAAGRPRWATGTIDARSRPTPFLETGSCDPLRGGSASAKSHPHSPEMRLSYDLLLTLSNLFVTKTRKKDNNRTP